MNVVRHLPFWLPFHRAAKKGREMIDGMVTKPYEHAKRETVLELVVFALIIAKLTP